MQVGQHSSKVKEYATKYGRLHIHAAPISLHTSFHFTNIRKNIKAMILKR
jgi:hypothetical protein